MKEGAGSHMTGSSVGKPSPGKTSTGRCPTLDFIMRHSPDALGRYQGVRIASRTIMWHMPAPVTQIVQYWGLHRSNNPRFGNSTLSRGVSEICKRFNDGKCRRPTCRYRHSCSSCNGQHPRVSCFAKASGRAMGRSRSPLRMAARPFLTPSQPNRF